MATTSEVWQALRAWADNQKDYQSSGGKLNTHQWNYGHREITGIKAPAPEDMGLGNGNQPITFDDYQYARKRSAR